MARSRSGISPEVAKNNALEFLAEREGSRELQGLDTHEEIAEHLGIPVSHVERMWREWEADGTISYSAELGVRVLTPKGKDLYYTISNLQRLTEFLANALIKRDSKVVFLVGAGASAPLPAGIPPTAQLLKVLWEKGRRLGKKPIDDLENWCREREITNIEDVLTAAYVSDLLAKERPIQSLVQYLLRGSHRSGGSSRIVTRVGSNARRIVTRFDDRDIDANESPGIAAYQDTLSTLFHLLTATMIAAKPNRIHEAVAAISKHFPNAAIITTNYDLCVDEALASTGVKFSYQIRPDDEKSVLPLVKMHGSLNWGYCESCQMVFTPTVDALKQSHASEVGFGVLGICKHCGGQRKPMLVPPLKFKYLAYPPLLKIWNEGQRLIDEADVVIGIGYSFSDSDDYISKMLLRSLNKSTKKSVLLLNRSPDALRRVRDRIARHIDSFDVDRRVGGLHGDAVASIALLCEKLGVIVPAAGANGGQHVPVVPMSVSPTGSP